MNLLNVTSETLKRLIAQVEGDPHQADVLMRLKWFLHYLEYGKSATQTCREFGISRSTFHRWAKRFDANDLTSLTEKSHRPHRLRTSEVTPETIKLIRKYRIESPFISKYDLVKKLNREHGITLSASTVGRIISENKFFFGNSLAHRKKLNGSKPKLDKEIDVSLYNELEEVKEDEWVVFIKSLRVILGRFWRQVRLPLIIASITFNLIALAVLLMTASWESRHAANQAVTTPYEASLLNQSVSPPAPQDD